MNELENKRIKHRNIVFMLSLLRFFLILLPFAVLFAIRWEQYYTPTNGYGVTTSAIIGLVIWVLVERNQAGFLKGFWGITTLLVVTYMLQGILEDLILFEVAALFGAVTTAVLNPMIERNRKIRDAVDVASVNAQAMGSTTLNVRITDNTSGRV